MVRVDTDGISLQVEGEVAALGTPKLVLVKVRPSPDSSVNDVRKTFPSGDLFRRQQVLYLYPIQRILKGEVSLYC
jgi:hypothetical protein